MRRALPTAVAIAAAAAALAAVGCGDEQRSVGALGWVGTPRLLVAQTAPDRVLQGTIRNDSRKPVTILATDVRVLAADGRRVKAEVTFAAGLSKPLYPVDRPYVIADYDLDRLGKRLRLKPGQEAPLTVAWRLPDQPVELNYGAGAITIGDTQTLTH